MPNIEHGKICLELLFFEHYRGLKHLRFFGKGAHQFCRDEIQFSNISGVLRTAKCQRQDNGKEWQLPGAHSLCAISAIVTALIGSYKRDLQTPKMLFRAHKLRRSPKSAWHL